MVFNATFNNISALSWRSTLLMKETGVPGENHRPVASHGQTLNIWVDYFYCYLYIYIYNLIVLQTISMYVEKLCHGYLLICFVHTTK